MNPDIRVQHLFRLQHPYQVSTFNVTYNMLCIAYSHFKKGRIIKTIEIAKNNFLFNTVVEDIKANLELILKQREKYLKERIYSDDFFFEKFMILF